MNHAMYLPRNVIRMESGIFEPVRYPDYQWKTVVPTIFMPWLFELGYRASDKMFGMPVVADTLKLSGLTADEKKDFFKHFPELRERFFGHSIYQKGTLSLIPKNFEEAQFKKLPHERQEKYKPILKEINKKINYYDPLKTAGNYIDRYLLSGENSVLNVTEGAKLKKRLTQHSFAEQMLKKAMSSPEHAKEILRMTLLGNYTDESKLSDHFKEELKNLEKKYGKSYVNQYKGSFKDNYYKFIFEDVFNNLGIDYKETHAEYEKQYDDFQKELDKLKKKGEIADWTPNNYTRWLEYKGHLRRDDAQNIVRALRAVEYALSEADLTKPQHSTDKGFEKIFSKLKLTKNQQKEIDDLLHKNAKGKLKEYFHNRLKKDIKNSPRDEIEEITDKIKTYFDEALDNRKIAKELKNVKSRNFFPSMAFNVLLSIIFWGANSMMDVKFVQPWEYKKDEQGYHMPKVVRWPVYLGWLPGVALFAGIMSDKWVGKQSPLKKPKEKLKLNNSYIKKLFIAGGIGAASYLAICWAAIQANLKRQKPQAEARLIQQKRLESLNKTQYQVNVPEGFREAPLRRPDLFRSLVKTPFHPAKTSVNQNPFRKLETQTT